MSSPTEPPSDGSIDSDVLKVGADLPLQLVDDAKRIPPRDHAGDQPADIVASRRDGPLHGQAQPNR
jgi:hypothetical protein